MISDWEQRQVLRREMSARRGQMPRAQVEEYSRSIAVKLMVLQPLHQAHAIMAFAGIDNEVDLKPQIALWQAEDRRILLPRVEPGGGLAAVEFHGWQHTHRSRFGIQEPLGEPVDPGDIEVVIVPGLVFDGRGYRLGYGKGYYDRFLKLLPACTFLCGVCYDFQLVDTVLPHQADVAMHWIVTERSELAVNWDFF